MRKSIFFKLALIIIPIVLVLELVEVYVVYHSVYMDSYETCTKATIMLKYSQIKANIRLACLINRLYNV